MNVKGRGGEAPPAAVKISLTMVEGGDENATGMQALPLMTSSSPANDESATGTQADDYYGCSTSPTNDLLLSHS